jgi:putative nucleotidyltransferase with HDIG domain
MRNRTHYFIGLVGLLAALSTCLLYRQSPGVTADQVVAIVILGALALAGDTLGYLLPRSATGSLAFVPFFAAAILVPLWPSVIMVASVRLVVETVSRREKTKASFNVVQNAFALSAAIWIYISLGGVPLLGLGDGALSPVQLTRDLGLAAVVACAAALLLNNALVSMAIGLASGVSPWKIWKENSRVAAGGTLLSAPMIFLFAWVDARFGAIAASAMWVPILGLRQVHNTNIELAQTNRELLELMVKSLEARDPYTSGHSRRVQNYSLVIARAVGLGQRETEQVGRAALLHDVGKIHEKYASVLAKTDKLTPEEWSLIKEHPVDGANLVATMSKLRDIVPAVRHHHEKWDGTGYPDGLAGELIPLAARIITFADTIDAMITERPYRRPLDEEAVRAEIVRCRGSQFDPKITDALLSSSSWASLFPPKTPKRDDSVVAGELPKSTARRQALRVVG